MYRLLATHGHEEQIFPVPDGEAWLGSASENEIVLRVTGVSRRHALVRRLPEGVEVLDLGSKNGLFVEGRRVKRAVLTPGLRLQIGAAWLEIEEVSSSQAALELMLQSSSEQRPHPPSMTPIVQAGADRRKLSPADAALALAYHIAQVGAGLPGGRTDLFARIKATLAAETLASFERTRRGILRILESEGGFSPEETKLLNSLTEGARALIPEQTILKRTGRLLLAGREPWFLGARFAEEALAREGWRKDFLRFLAHELFAPVRNLDHLNASEAARVLALARGNKRRAAALLGISPGTLYKLLSHRSSPKR
jgi:Inner membrane component of T3SS, cytoplasmic domain/Bacterial regulatory protein, Fis family